MSAHAADQNSSLRKIILVLLALGVISMLSLIVAGAASLISFAERIHPVAGTVVFWGICLAAGFFALYCLIAYAQLPPALVPPNETSGPKRKERICRHCARDWRIIPVLTSYHWGQTLRLRPPSRTYPRKRTWLCAERRAQFFSAPR